MIHVSSQPEREAFAAMAPAPMSARPTKPGVAGRPGDPRRLTPAEAREAVEEVEPLLKWPGGKRNLLPSFSRSCRPMCTPASTGAWSSRSSAEPRCSCTYSHARPCLADANADLVNFYIQVRDHLDDLLPILDAMARRPYTDEVYYEVRASSPRSRLRRAARFLYLSKYGFNGLYRVNRKGQFNVAFGRTSSGKRPNLYAQDNIAAVSALLQRAELYTSSFEALDSRVLGFRLSRPTL